MPQLGKKYTCYSCHTKFYDLGKAVPLCPKCGADQRDAEETPVVTAQRGKRIVEEPIDEVDFGTEGETPVPEVEDDEDILTPADREEDLEEDEEEEEEF